MKKITPANLLNNPYFILLFSLVVYLINFSHPFMSNDEGIWSYIGRVWNRNNILPYTGAIENKTPGIFELYCLSDMLFGTNVFFVRTLGLLSILFSSLLLYHIGAKLQDKLCGILSMLLFNLTMNWDLLDGSYFAHTENFMILFILLSLFFLLKINNKTHQIFWIFLSGFSIGFAMAFKQIAVTSAAGFVLFGMLYYTNKFKIKQLLVALSVFTGGLLLASLISVVPILISGVSFSSYFEGAWKILLNSGSSNTSLRGRYVHFMEIWTESRLTVFYPLFLLMLFKKKSGESIYIVGLLIWMGLEFLATNSSGNYFGHQLKQFIAPLVLIISITISKMINNNNNSSMIVKHSFFAIGCCILLTFPYKETIQSIYLIATNKKLNYYHSETGVFLKNNTQQNDYVFYIGTKYNQLLSTSQRLSASKYINSYFVTSEDARNCVLNDLINKTPGFIIAENSFDRKLVYGDKIDNFILTHYVLFQTIDDITLFKKVN